jgi:hypothetical protein
VIFQNPKKRAKGFRIIELPNFHVRPSWQGELEVFPCSKLYIPGKSIILEASSMDDKDYHNCGTLPGCRCLVQVSAYTDSQTYGLHLKSDHVEKKILGARHPAHRTYSLERRTLMDCRLRVADLRLHKTSKKK